MSLQPIVLLFLFQLMGEGIAYVTKLPLPGPVIGMLLLLMSLHAFPSLASTIERASTPLLQHLSLLFVPAGVGVLVTAGAAKANIVAILVSVGLSTLLTLAVCALSTRFVLRKQSGMESGGHDVHQ